MSVRVECILEIDGKGEYADAMAQTLKRELGDLFRQYINNYWLSAYTVRIVKEEWK